MFGKSIKDKLIEYLTGKDFVKLDDITLAMDLSRTKTKQALYQLKYKKLVEKDDNDNWKLLAVTPVAQESTAEEDIATSTPEPPAEIPVHEEEKANVKPANLSHEVADIQKKLDLVLGMKQKKEKKAKLKKFNLAKLKRYNKGKSRACIYLQRNHNISLIKGEYINGMLKLNNNYHDAGAAYVWQWEGKQPVYIVGEWSIRPMMPKEEYDRAVTERTLIDSQLFTIQAMKQIEADSTDEFGKKKPNMMMYVGIAIAAIVVIYLFMG